MTFKAVKIILKQSYLSKGSIVRAYAAMQQQPLGYFT